MDDCLSIKNESKSEHVYGDDYPTLQNNDFLFIHGTTFGTGRDTAVLRIPLGIEVIDESACEGCSKIVHVIIPDSVRTIKKGAFKDCVSLKEVEIHGKLRYIEAEAFSGCRSLTDIEIPDSVISIDNHTFYGCSNLTSIELPSVSRIGDCVFQNCNSLTNIKLANSITKIGHLAFDGCTNILQTENGIQYFDRWAVGHNGLNESVTLRPDTIGIADKTFTFCGTLKDVVIPNSVEYIGAQAFSHCDGITSIIIPNSVTHIGARAFSACKNLMFAYIPSSVSLIDLYAFGDCDMLTVYAESEKKPREWYDWNSSEFFSTYGIVSGSVEKIKKGCGVVWGCSKVDGIMYKVENNIASLISCIDIVSGEVKVPQNIHYLDKEYCVRLIDKEVFSNNCSITSVEMPHVVGIGARAFKNCRALTSIEIPNNVGISVDAFSNCFNLKNVKFNGTRKEWKYIAKQYKKYHKSKVFVKGCQVTCADGVVKI